MSKRSILKLLNPESATLRVRMRQTAAGPDGVFENAEAYEVDRDVAIQWVAEHLAEWCEDPAEKQENAPADYPGPWSPADWRRGIDLGAWAAWRAPPVYGQLRDNVEMIRDLGERNGKAHLCRRAAGQLKTILKDDLESGLIELGTRETPLDEPTAIPAEARRAVVDGISFRGSVIFVDYSVSQMTDDRGVDYQVPIRLYSPDRFDVPTTAKRRRRYEAATLQQRCTDAAADLRTRNVEVTPENLFEILIADGEDPDKLKLETLRKYIRDLGLKSPR